MSIVVVEWKCRNLAYNLGHHFENMKIQKHSKQLLGKRANEPLTSHVLLLDSVKE